MRAQAAMKAPPRQAAPTESSSFHLHSRPFAGQSRAPAPAFHDLASISIRPPGGAPIQRAKGDKEKEAPWWKKAGNWAWGAARDSSIYAKTAVSGGLAAAGSAIGTLAVGGTAALTASAVAPAAAVGAGAYLAYRGLDWAMSPKAAPEEAQLDLPREGLTERPKKSKAKALKGAGALTAHHKIPYNQIRDTINDATGNSWGSLIPGRQARAKANLAIWGAREDPAQDKLAPKGLNSTPHNFFMGPLESNRADDPENELDTHFTASGTVTPKSEAALDITHQGGLSKIDPEVLRKRLQRLADKQVSAHNAAEWQGPADARTQRGQPPGWANLTTAQKVKAVENRKKAKQAAQDKKKGKKKHN